MTADLVRMLEAVKNRAACDEDYDFVALVLKKGEPLHVFASLGLVDRQEVVACLRHVAVNIETKRASLSSRDVVR